MRRLRTAPHPPPRPPRRRRRGRRRRRRRHRPGASAAPPRPPAKPLAQAIYDAAHAPAVAGHHRAHPLHEQPAPLRLAARGQRVAGDHRRRRPPLADRATAGCGSSCSRTPATRRSCSATARFSVYDATSNTVYTGALAAAAPRKPASRADARRHPTGPGEARPDVEPVRRHSRARPPASRATPCGSRPKDDGGLLGAAELAWDAAHGVPLRAAVYAQGQTTPVLELEATHISYGKIAASRRDGERRRPARRPSSSTRPRGHDAQGNPTRCTALDAVQKQVGFPSRAPEHARRPAAQGGPARVKVGERERRARHLRPGPRRDRRAPEHRAPARTAGAGGGLRLPQINIDGATGTELATALGTVLTFERGGVSYIVAGSVPPVAAENAARGLK